MFRCAVCENYHDKSECEIHPLNEYATICWECLQEEFCCVDCGEVKKDCVYNKYIDAVICEKCIEMRDFYFELENSMEA